MREGFEKIVCPICEGNKLNIYLKTFDRFQKTKIDDFSIVKCENCDFVFLNPRPDINNINQYYDNDGYDPFLSTDKKPSLRDKFYVFLRNYNLSNKYSKISKIKPSPGKILDIGCATGEFLEKFKKYNWQCTGVEVSEDARNVAKSKKINLYSSIHDIPENEKFDIITMWHVLEHVHDLNDSIKKINSLLKDNGSLIIAVPNINSYDAKIYGKNWIALDTPRHLYHFSEKTISQLFRNYNMNLIKRHTLFLDILYNNLLSKNLKKSGFISFSITLLISLFKTYILSLKNSSTLVYYFKKGKNNE